MHVQTLAPGMTSRVPLIVVWPQVEDPKKALLLFGGRTSQVVKDVLSDFGKLKGVRSIMFCSDLTTKLWLAPQCTMACNTPDSRRSRSPAGIVSMGLHVVLSSLCTAR